MLVDKQQFFGTRYKLSVHEGTANKSHGFTIISSKVETAAGATYTFVVRNDLGNLEEEVSTLMGIL